MTINNFIEKLKITPSEIAFQDTMQVIESYYNFKPTKFSNGDCINEEGQNSGSCKLFSFAKLHQLTKEETLSCFGTYYTDVLASPEGKDHQNIRNFMRVGWEGVSFDQDALIKKQA
ncbi:HopJ type III effector protein [Aquimarina addita]|uniref:HopJ type III effector protein n=1 Tax=Aquimarina addita TaxID=870485 RepID=A0ABP6UU63_9FLAO